MDPRAAIDLLSVRGAGCAGTQVTPAGAARCCSVTLASGPQSPLRFPTSIPAVRAGGGDAYQPLQQAAEGLDAVCTELLNMVPSQPRVPGPNFLFAVDHCFSIKGQGTVLTGTVLQVWHQGLMYV